METRAQTFSQQLQREMAAVEKRDWELWILVLVTLGILASGLFVFIFPAVFLRRETLRMEASFSPQLLVGLMVLVTMFVIYVVHKHLQIRSLRFHSVMNAWNWETAQIHLLIDPLTKAYNRSALEEVLAGELARVRSQQASLIFLVVDVDQFKHVNSHFGRLSGDLVLAEVGNLLKQSVRGADYVIRLGGDQFLVALLETDVEGAKIVKRRIGKRVGLWNQTSPLPGFTLSLSIGVEPFEGSRSLDEVLAEADARMEEDKKSHAPGPSANL